MNDEPEVYCTNCGWEGNTNQLNSVACPKCGEGKYIEDYNPEYCYDNEIMGEGSFNWNKK